MNSILFLLVLVACVLVAEFCMEWVVRGNMFARTLAVLFLALSLFNLLGVGSWPF